MFGSTMSLRNWTAEGARGSKSPTHVNVYRAKSTKEWSGLDSEGMILVALMSGGDYVPAGMPGCGPKIACEAAKAGFGRDLCSIPTGDVPRLREWRERLSHELNTNESKFFRQKHKALKVPENFPDMKVLGYYTHPAVSSMENLSKLRQEIDWDSGIKVSELRMFVADAFNWTCLSGAKKFIRGLAPALLAHRLNQRSVLQEDDATIEAKESAEAHLVTTIYNRRSHWNTDGMPELRIAYIPNDIVRIDLDAEEEDFQEEDVSEEEQHASGDDLARERSQSPGKKRGPPTYDPTKAEKIWVLETYVKLGVPLLVETWEEDMRDLKKFASRKARAKKNLSKPKASTGTGVTRAMDQYVKVRKPRNPLASDAEDLIKALGSDQPPPVFLAPALADTPCSPQRKAFNENRRPAGQKVAQKDKEFHEQRAFKAKMKTKAKTPGPETLSPSTMDTTANPWTLSKRPPDTLRFRSPTRYSALGIYAPDDPEHNDNSQEATNLLSDRQGPHISPPTSPNPRKRHSKPTTPPSSPESNHPAPFPDSPSTPRSRNPTKPSPRKKRSPLEKANELYLSGQLRTPTSLRKETILDRFIVKEDEALTEKKVNRRLEFDTPQSTGAVASPVSVDDESELPSPSTLLSPQILEENDVNGSGAILSSFEIPASPTRQDKARSLVALRESLEGAWRHLDPNQNNTRAARRVYSSVEVVDLTGV